MFLRRLVLLLSCFALVPTARAVTVGTMPPSGGTTVSRFGDAAPLTLIDLTNPASETGTLTAATVRWTSAPEGGCASAFRIKTIRPLATGQYQVVAERGPFNAVNGINAVTLSPAITVFEHDLLAVTQLKPLAGCGGVSHGRPVGIGATRTNLLSDPPAGMVVAPSVVANDFVGGFRASSSSEVLEGYLTVVGSVQGAFGSNFKTAVQMTNMEFGTINGRFLFHRAGAPASASDPSLAFTIPPFATISYDDLVGAMGQTGLGSIDVYTTNSYAPDITVRVFNDEGSAGTSGVTEEMRLPQLALTRFQFGLLTGPADPANLRLNIGVRTLDLGATLFIEVFDSNGLRIEPPIERSYPPNYFEQVTAAEFTGKSVPANGVITVNVSAGSAIVYGGFTDNRTNDPNMKWFTRF